MNIKAHVNVVKLFHDLPPELWHWVDKGFAPHQLNPRLSGGQVIHHVYIMNPPGSAHAPFSAAGCTLFVKLRHLEPDQIEREVVDTLRTPWLQGLVPGLQVMPLMRQGSGSTLVRWAPQTFFNPHRHFGGEEIFVISGVFSDEHGHYPQGTWIRSPHMSQHKPFSQEGCTIFVKTGHLMT